LLATAAAWLVPLELMPGVLARFGLSGPAQPHDWVMAVGSLAVLGILGTGFAVLLVIWLIVTEGPLFAGMVTYVVPTLALVWGAIDGEVITGRQLAAMAGVLAMVALVQFGGKPDVSKTELAEPHFCPSENPVDVAVLGGGDGESGRG
jgi:drug/metabolite transporter (DMT)-like permease